MGSEMCIRDRGPDAIVSSDTRTNSVIVNAAPRDLEEVALLIKKLDSGTN